LTFKKLKAGDMRHFLKKIVASHDNLRLQGQLSNHIIGAMTQPYFDIVRLIERLHRHFLDVLRTELHRQGVEDINAVQALLLYNIGEDDVVIRDLKDRGYYHGSNVSYNIKKLTEFDYLMQERSAHDRRSIRLHLTEKGARLRDAVRDLQNNLSASLGATEEQQGDLDAAAQAMLRVERTWTDFIRHGRK
jgi:DNA-binding MarR family transcriptional regulator